MSNIIRSTINYFKSKFIPMSSKLLLERLVDARIIISYKITGRNKISICPYPPADCINVTVDISPNEVYVSKTRHHVQPTFAPYVKQKQCRKYKK